MTLTSRLVFNIPKQTPGLKTPRIQVAEVSIIIPVKNNQKGIDNYLERFLETHTRRDFPKQIIIVDNNSSSPIHIQTKYFDRGLSISVIECSKPGPAAARNAGANYAIGSWLLFNDSDCVPTNSLINGYLNSDNSSVAYAGNVKGLNKSLVSKYYESQEILIPLKIHNGESPQYLITANSLVWKKAFEVVGGFNESITIAGGEDVDLGLRLSGIGNLSYAPSSIVLHDFNDGIAGFGSRFIRYGFGNRLIEELWGTNMTPVPFKPNRSSIFNYCASKLQYVLLWYGYNKAHRKIMRGKLSL